MEKSVALQISNVSYQYQGGKKLKVLDNVSFNSGVGEVMSFIGPSGCGKSTLLRLIADLLPFSEGEITLNGKSPSQARKDREYAFIFQKPVMFDWRNVEKNISLPLEICSTPKSKRKQLLDEVLETTGLSEYRNYYPWMLSGGMLQEVALARALVLKPKILLLDEPFAALDEINREKMQLELIKLIAKYKSSVILVTHSIEEAVFLSDRIIVFTPCPGKIQKNIKIDLPHPRNFNIRNSQAFFKYTSLVRTNLKLEKAYE